jgi:predicted nucleotidyltransferase
MDPEEYERFTRDLEKELEADPRVLGLVALGSTARGDHLPDRWSDHDFFVVVTPGTQESFRSNLGWLPRSGEIALSFRETAHGVKVVFRDGHLIEFAVFDPDELAVARVNRYRILFDRERTGERLARVARETAARAAPPSDEWLVGQFLTNLLVGVGRHHRGERLSGRQLVTSSALAHLVALLTKHVRSPDTAKLDSLDPLRRFEMVYPALGRRLDAALVLPTPGAALALLDIALDELPGRIPPAAVAAIRPRLNPGTFAE